MFFSVSILHHSSPFIASCLSTPFYQKFDGSSFIKPQATYLASIQQFPLPRSFKVSTMNQSFYHTYYHALGLSAHISCCFQSLICSRRSPLIFAVYLQNWILTYISCCFQSLICSRRSPLIFAVYLQNWILTYFLPFSCCLVTYIFSSTTCLMYTQICYIL